MRKKAKVTIIRGERTYDAGTITVASGFDVLAEEYKDKYSNPLYAACMDVILRANKNAYGKRGKEGTNMCQALTELVYEWYGDEIEEELEWDYGFVDQICQVIRNLSAEATNDNVLNKWREQFAMQ